MQNREIKGKSPPVRGSLTGGLLVFLQKKEGNYASQLLFLWFRFCLPVSGRSYPSKDKCLRTKGGRKRRGDGGNKEKFGEIFLLKSKLVKIYLTYSLMLYIILQK